MTDTAEPQTQPSQQNAQAQQPQQSKHMMTPREKKWIVYDVGNSAFMESYFDVLFALNRRTHPGEKRLDKLAERDCAILPKDFRKNIDTLFDSMYADQAVFSETLGEIVDDLRQTVDANL